MEHNIEDQTEKRLTLDEVIDKISNFYESIPEDKKLYTTLNADRFFAEHKRWEQDYADTFVFVESDLEKEFVLLAYHTLKDRLGHQNITDEQIMNLSQLFCTIYLLGVGMDNWGIGINK